MGLGCGSAVGVCVGALLTGIPESTQDAVNILVFSSWSALPQPLFVVFNLWSMLADRLKASLWAIKVDFGEALGLVSESALSSSPMALM